MKNVLLKNIEKQVSKIKISNFNISSMFGLFKRTKNENGRYKKPYYSFRSVSGGRVLDVAQDGEHQGTTILWDGYGGENQSFTIKQKGPHYVLKCKKNKQFLTVDGSGNGAKIYTAPKSGEANQRFTIDQAEPGSKEYIIYTYCGKVLDCAQEGKKNGTQVIQWDYHGGKNQRWNFCEPNNITSSSSEQD